jgi:hypothetical protein
MYTINKKIRAFIMGALLGLIIAPLPVWSTHYQQTLEGSFFEIDTDANLVLNSGGLTKDWATVAEIRQEDPFTGSDDDAFGQGSKEDTPVPSPITGSIPPNKSDLKFFGVYQEGSSSSGFLNLFWSRVQDPSGTTNMDFEFNQSTTLSSNGVTPVRTAGDMLIQYDLSQGGTNPVLFLSRWVTSGSSSQCEASNTVPCWGTRVSLSATDDASGSINTSAIAAGNSDGLGAQDPRTFGEAQIDLSAIFDPDICQSFGSAYLKSRSSDSFTAAMKDFIAPVPVNISNCGKVRINKKNDANQALPGAQFELFKDNAPLGGPAPHGNEDIATGQTCTTDPSGTCLIDNVLQGQYWVVETVTPAGHDTAADVNINVPADQEVTVNLVDPRQRGAILITKTRKHAALGSGDHPHAGVNFTVNGVTKATDVNGKACFDGLLFNSYTVHETTPAGYQGEADKTVAVNNKASCTDDPYVGETVSFHNTPLSNITVSFASQVLGGTLSKISCTGLTSDPADVTPNAFDDVSETFKNLVPGTYTCTVVVDP